MGRHSFIRYTLALLLFCTPVYATPSNTMSVTPVATSGQTINAADENSRNNEISSKYNAHSHTDLTNTTGNTFTVGDGVAGSKTYAVNNELGSDPALRRNSTQWTLTEDGSNYSTIVRVTGASATHFSLPNSVATGDVMYSNGADWTALNASSNTDHVLRSAGATTAPSWQISPMEDLYTGAGEILYSDAVNSAAVLAAGSSGQVLISGGAAAPAWGSAQFDPTLILEFYDDFESLSTNAAEADTAGTARFINSKYAWVVEGGDISDAQGVGGIIDLTGDGTNNSVFFVPNGDGIADADATEFIQTSKNPTVVFRFKAVGTEATRTDWIGLADAVTDGTEFATGVFVEWNAGGNIFVTADDGSQESDDTGVDIDTGTSWHTMKLVFSGGNSVAWDLNGGAATGTLTTNVPSDTFTFAYTSSKITDGAGINLDYVYVRQTR